MGILDYLSQLLIFLHQVEDYFVSDHSSNKWGQISHPAYDHSMIFVNANIDDLVGRNGGFLFSTKAPSDGREQI
jgi:hypothetical protein